MNHLIVIPALMGKISVQIRKDLKDPNTIIWSELTSKEKLESVLSRIAKGEIGNLFKEQQ